MKLLQVGVVVFRRSLQGAASRKLGQFYLEFRPFHCPARGSSAFVTIGTFKTVPRSPQLEDRAGRNNLYTGSSSYATREKRRAEVEYRVTDDKAASQTSSNTGTSSTGSNTGSSTGSAQSTGQKAGQVAQDAQVKAGKAAENVKARVGEAAREAGGRAEGVKDKVKEQAGEARGRVQAEAEKGFERGKGRVAERVSSVAHAFRKTGEQLREEEQGDLAGYTDRVAEQVEKVSGYLEGKGLRDVMDDVSAFARRQPGLFVGGALVAGLVAARFLRSSGHSGGGYSSGDEPYR